MVLFGPMRKKDYWAKDPQRDRPHAPLAGTFTYNVCSTYPSSALSSFCPLRVPVVFR